MPHSHANHSFSSQCRRILALAPILRTGVRGSSTGVRVHRKCHVSKSWKYGLVIYGSTAFNKHPFHRYWDWVADSQAPASAAVWDPVTGFGGNGNMTSTGWGTNCVLDGPFTGLRPVYWNNAAMPHCLLRSFAPGSPEDGVPEMYGASYSPSVMASINMETTFEGFRHNLENFPHGAVHQGVGGFVGDMGPQTSSPNGQSLLTQIRGLQGLF